MVPIERAYARVAWCYDELAQLYSLGRIGRAKRDHLGALAPGDRVLYAGAGRGAEAVQAARLGARVTCLDRTEAMLVRLRRSAARAGVTLQVQRADVRDPAATEAYDGVVANFFLNVFTPPELSGLASRLIGSLRPGGFLAVADFARPSGGAWARAVQHASYRLADAAGRVLGLAPWQPLHDYARFGKDSGLRLERRRSFPAWRGGPPLYEAFLWRR
ncbi:MAG: class I SAM-dependent methyltransferase [Proteobacteria bacterium]|nr:class I SAM-dependent methyltransferase [Pseudomonadota bacterium]